MKMLNKSALVTDGIWRKSLAAVRALSKSGIKVVVGERTWMAPAFLSRYASRRYVYPSLEKDPNSFLNWLEFTVKSNKYDVLITPEEETSLLVAQHSSELSSYIRIPLAQYEKLTFTRNKFNLLTHAQGLGILCPKTFIASKPGDAQRSIQELSFPLVLKPVIGTGGQGICYVPTKDTFDAQYNSMRNKYETFLMQEYIPGNDYYGVSVIFNARNQMRSAFVHKKLRQYPLTGGASTYAVSVKFPRLIEIAEALLASIGWYGCANIEFKIDQRDGTPKLMEVNPRLWGSLQLAVASGINVPYLLYQLAVNGDIPPNFEYQTGVKFCWFMQGDFMNFVTNLTAKRKFNLDVFKLFRKNSCHATWSLSDPLPSLGLSLSLIDYLTSDEMKKYRS